MESEKDSEKRKDNEKEKNKENKDGQKEKNSTNLFKEMDFTDDDIKDKESFTSERASEQSERRMYVHEGSYSQSSSSGDEANKFSSGEYDPFLDPYRSSQKNYPPNGPVLSGTLTPFKLPPRSASAPLSERKEDKSSKVKSTRDDNAKATVTDFLPSVRGGDDKTFNTTIGDEKRRDRDRDRDRDRENCKADTVSLTANPMLSNNDKGGRESRSSSQSTQPSQLSQSDSSDKAPEKKQKIKLTELASKGIESSQLLDLGSSPAFEKIQRREEQIIAQRERENERTKKRHLGVMANSDLAELLARPVRHSSSSSLSRGERDRVGRRRTGISAVTKEQKEEGNSPKNVPKQSVSTGDSNTTSANTAANRTHFGSDSNPSGANLSTSRRYFHLELVDPQLNFLDTKSHSSLIMVSGRSSLEGHR